MGSVSTRVPSISMSVVEWPSQVTRRPDAGGDCRRAAASEAIGRGQLGTRISRPKSHRPNAEKEPAFMSEVGSSFEKCPPA